MGFTTVAPGQIATIVTALEMLARPKPAPTPSSPLRLVRWKQPGIAAYRTLFTRVGAPWLWFSRLVMADDALNAILADQAVEVFAVIDPHGIEVGILELDFRTAANCEIAYFGLVPELAGQGHGQWLMSHALSLGWRAGITRMWVHSCTLDHPGALGFYRKAGFVPFKREVETFDDPRLIGILPRDVAPQVPIL